MDICEFSYDLPAELVAQQPETDRSAARLLHLSRDTDRIVHSTVAALPSLLTPGDLLVVNDTRVFPARLLGRRLPGGGAAECLLLARVGPDRWEALVHPGQRLKVGSRMVFQNGRTLHAEILDRLFHGRRIVRLWTDDGTPVDDAVDAIGHVPLPPYIKRPDLEADRDRYQTVFARTRGSVAAPTAGLHFGEPLLAALAAAGIERTEITLHVGYGTFQPVRVERIEDHRLEPERFEIGESAANAINHALAEKRRIVAVGTTTTRALEAAALGRADGVAAGAGETDLFIRPGFRFRVTGALVTNFHLPRSSLLVLVAAFAGRERVLAAYEEAVRRRYRFYSYGDAMLIT
jgi:S-adenosylmethionine:tRNA ribosyltransferase-isomerase